MFPVAQTWGLSSSVPLGRREKPPDSTLCCSKKCSMELWIRLSSPGTPRSTRTINCQVVEAHFGTKQDSGFSQYLPSFCFWRSSAAHPFFPIFSRLFLTSGSFSLLPRRPVRAKYCTEGSSASNQSTRDFDTENSGSAESCCMALGLE